ncbi:MAG: MjaI family restriction endonuclease [Anaerovoracaceae bacterium]
MKYRISNAEIKVRNNSEENVFPKYTTQLINLANQTAQATRPKAVGQLSELFPLFLQETDQISLENWQEWYEERYPEAVDKAADRIYGQIEKLREAVLLIDREMIRRWVKDLIIDKTYNGLYVQKVILSFLSEKRGEPYRLSSPEEEAKGIDGYVGDTAYSIKPSTYQAMDRLPETIDVSMIYYEKTKSGLVIEIDEED